MAATALAVPGDFTGSVLELIRRVATRLPADVLAALEKNKAAEKSPVAGSILGTILENCRLAAAESVPICQDTGALLFSIHHPFGYSTAALRARILAAVEEATRQSLLRPNAVDPVTGKNTGNNLGSGSPVTHFAESDRSDIRVELLLKGGGSENVSTQYSLPNMELGAGRDLAGVRRVALDAVHKAQGKGCAPGILGVAIGGDRASSFLESKHQLQRKLDDRNPDRQLADLEAQIVAEANRLGIGPMGLGGGTTLLGAKIGTLHRHPASFFVSVSYVCWACRRGFLTITPEGKVSYGD